VLLNKEADRTLLHSPLSIHVNYETCYVDSYSKKYTYYHDSVVNLDHV